MHEATSPRRLCDDPNFHEAHWARRVGPLNVRGPIWIQINMKLLLRELLRAPSIIAGAPSIIAGAPSKQWSGETALQQFFFRKKIFPETFRKTSFRNFSRRRICVFRKYSQTTSGRTSSGMFPEEASSGRFPFSSERSFFRKLVFFKKIFYFVIIYF